MRRIYVKDLRAGQTLPKALFTPSGLKLLPAGTRLSRGRVSSLRRSYSGPLYLAASYHELRSALSGEAAATPSGPIDVGADPRRQKADTGDAAHRREWMRRVRRAERDLDEQLDRWEGLDRRVEPGLRPIELEPPGRLGWPSTSRLRAYRADRVRRIAALHRAILSNELVTISEPMYLVRELIDLYIGYPDRFARLATIGAAGGERPIAEHALSVAALSVAIAVRLGWSLYDVQRAGLAGLFADLGMTLDPQDGRGPLDEIASSRLRRHPLASGVMLEAVEDVAEPVRLAVTQHHERLDGSGYPLGLRADEIHDIARVLAVTDSFAAAIAPRAHRAPNRPHAAMVDVCRRALAGELDRGVAMALVRAVGVFPVGASVALDTGDAAVVVSSKAESPAHPTLRLLSRPAGAEFAAELDLSTTEGVRITAELAPAEAIDARGARLAA